MGLFKALSNTITQIRNGELHPLRIAYLVFICIPLVAAVIAMISTTLYWGFFDGDAILSGIIALFFSGIICIPLALFFRSKANKIHTSQDNSMVSSVVTTSSISTTKEEKKVALKDVMKQLSDVGKETKQKFSESHSASKEAKAPVEGAFIRYEIYYIGGLVKYPKSNSGGIGLNIMPDRFILKPESWMINKFDEMEIPYDNISKIEIVKRQVSTMEALLSSSSADAKALEQDTNIEITYKDNDGLEILLRLAMLSGIIVYDHAKKCKEMMDVLRQHHILERINKSSDAQTRGGTVDVAEQILKLNGLKEAGILTEDEFNTKKAELLAKM